MTPADVGITAEDRLALPPVALPRAPAAATIWARTLILAGIALAFFLLDQIALLLMDYWMLEGLGFENVFWTNFWMGTGLFVVAFAAFGIAVALPAFVQDISAIGKRRAIQAGVLIGLVAGYIWAGQYDAFLLFFRGVPFNETDPVFHHDLAFYVFDLPAIRQMLHVAALASVTLLVSSCMCAYVGRKTTPPPGMSRLTAVLGVMFARLSVIAFALAGLALAAEVWLSRYEVLTKNNYDSSVTNGAEYIDVTGFFSTVNGYTVTALAIFFGVGALAVRLGALHRAATRQGPEGAWKKIGAVSLIFAMFPGFAIDMTFKGMLALRNDTQVTPNEPVVQFPYIQRHIDASRKAYGFEEIETIDFVPNGPDDPLPEINELMRSPTIKNAPLWPGYVAWLEQLVDPEYVERILLDEEGDTTIYGPTLEIFNAQQKLRPYYEFMDIDTVRYHENGEDKMYASSVRELPLVEPQPWLAWWGQRFLVFTHGQGIVAAPVNDADEIGEPNYHAENIPARVENPELALENPDVYYGEGSGSMGYSNVTGVAEHDFPTEQGRAETFFPEDVNAGVRIDSFLKRIVFGWKSRQFFDIVFSDLVTDNTRVHYFRTPLERIEHIAPFLYTDTDPYAVAADGGVAWMLNGMTHTDKYPYSAIGDLGDKSVRRTPTPRPVIKANYIKDSVKMTIDSYTGQVGLYKFADEPIVNSWDAIYPGLLRSESEMPPELREQVQYPVQLMHVQMDDWYIYYHVTDPLTFFSFEDAFDDADEVVGPILDEGRSITFSIEPYYWIAEAKDPLPSSSDPSQFAISTVFTPEGALNLRAIITAYQDGEDYGKIHMLQVPKGQFFPGPEQADSAIDQDAFISQQIGLWNRMGLEVIRGHTTPLVVENEVIYVEPMFIRSKQNPVPQLKRVVVVFRGRAVMGNDLRDALRNAVSGAEQEPFSPLAPSEEEGGGGGPPAGKGSSQANGGGE
jgi:uncharacterized membrane protein (UPF0182 family)